MTEPTTELHAGFSSPDAQPRPWSEAQAQLEQAAIYWLSTVRPDGRPHVTPLIAVWLDDALHFCTGPEERKMKNLTANPSCVVTTGRNDIDEGFDVVLEGAAVQLADDVTLQRIAKALVAKYGVDWTFAVDDGVFRHDGGVAPVFQVVPSKAFSFGKGETSSQTRYRF